MRAVCTASSWASAGRKSVEATTNARTHPPGHHRSPTESGGMGGVFRARPTARARGDRIPRRNRTPNVSATVDVSDPTAFDVYLNGEHSGALPAPACFKMLKLGARQKSTI